MLFQTLKTLLNSTKPIAEPTAVETSTLNSTPAAGIAGSPTPMWQTANYSPDKHAQQLLRWLTAKGWQEEILFPQMLSEYHAMCHENGWAVRPWNPVACAFTSLTSGRKIYRWVYDPSDGQQHRLRVYPPYRSDTGSNDDAITPARPVSCGLRQAA